MYPSDGVEHAEGKRFSLQIIRRLRSSCHYADFLGLFSAQAPENHNYLQAIPTFFFCAPVVK